MEFLWGKTVNQSLLTVVWSYPEGGVESGNERKYESMVEQPGPRENARPIRNEERGNIERTTCYLYLASPYLTLMSEALHSLS